MSESKLWANSGDSHSLGERAVWDEILPKELADRMPRSEKFDGYEIVHVDGKSFRRELPKLDDEEGRRQDDRRARDASAARATSSRGCATSTTRASGPRSCTTRSGSGSR